jgi:hypothetical protein
MASLLGKKEVFETAAFFNLGAAAVSAFWRFTIELAGAASLILIEHLGGFLSGVNL